ncbi:MAG: HesA/MoeB/ThiF family protein [Planctomycetaceae bacterium]|jgi:molybdopterin-synthase adenylyltransferase|nr:HesA/MoeB/ThiF family protein [Planctomycetaceae bacterium]MDG2390414.1 HesA/MoeB/ThiF family protein [Planctomycetaceae bacterium]
MTDCDLPLLNDDERARYEWQLWTPEFGEEGQRKLKAATVLVSRVGGVGGTVAYYLAAAGVGNIVLAHAGNVKPSDLNRQLLMTTDWLGKPRVESAVRRLNELNPHVNIVPVAENMSDQNADKLIREVDVVVDAAPLFCERFAMNQAAVDHRKPLIEAAMFDFEAQLTTIIPGKTPCVKCLWPENPPEWKREFPVFGPVSGTVAAMAAVEVIKLLTGIGDLMTNRMLRIDLRTMKFRELPIAKNPACSVCGSILEN